MKRKTSDVHVEVILFFNFLRTKGSQMKKRVKEEVIEENLVVYSNVWLSLTFVGWLGTASFKSDPIKPFKVARDSCDVTHSLTQASIHTSHVHASKSCTKYSLHLVQSTSRHTNVIMLYAVKWSLYVVAQFLMQDTAKSWSSGVKMWQNCLVCQNKPGDKRFFFSLIPFYSS